MLSCTSKTVQLEKLFLAWSISRRRSTQFVAKLTVLIRAQQFRAQELYGMAAGAVWLGPWPQWFLASRLCFQFSPFLSPISNELFVNTVLMSSSSTPDLLCRFNNFNLQSYRLACTFARHHCCAYDPRVVLLQLCIMQHIRYINSTPLHAHVELVLLLRLILWQIWFHVMV